MVKLRLGQLIMRKRRIDFVLKNIKKEWKILDCACGDGWLTEHLTNLGYDITGIDLNPCEDIKSKENIKRKGKYLNADLREIPLASNSYDCIISINTLEHVVCEDEFYRILKFGGKLLVECPIFDFPFIILDKLKLIQPSVEEHIRIVNFKKLPFKLLSRKDFGLILVKFGVFIKEDL